MNDKNTKNSDENNNYKNNTEKDINSKTSEDFQKNLENQFKRIPFYNQEIIGKPQIPDLPPNISEQSNSNFNERKFFDEHIFPLLSILYSLSGSSATLAASVDILSKTYTKHPDRSELKDTIHLIYNINEECEDVYEVLKRRINKLLKLDK